VERLWISDGVYAETVSFGARIGLAERDRERERDN